MRLQKKKMQIIWHASMRLKPQKKRKSLAQIAKDGAMRRCTYEYAKIRELQL